MAREYHLHAAAHRAPQSNKNPHEKGFLRQISLRDSLSFHNIRKLKTGHFTRIKMKTVLPFFRQIASS
jgi:hypothetical protein